ncbi:PQQ-binding-like beta-propeller repeat protein [Natrialbaceae archaeon A-arb3/5]
MTDTETTHATGSGFRRISLGEIEPARSRHMWTRSAVHVTAGLLVSGEWSGTVTAYDPETLERRWAVDHPDHAVGITTFGGDEEGGGSVVVAGRGETGTIAAYDAETGEQHWRYDTAEDVGETTRESVFYLPYAVALETGEGPDGDGRLYAAARRYERDGETRQWHSTAYAFDAEGTVQWRYETDASPISIDLADDGDRLAVGYNRCLGEHDTGLVVLSARTGDVRWSWDPGTEGDRRVGDVSFDGDSLAVASHGDKRGYLLGPRGAERWAVDLAVERESGDETLYAYPNHVSAEDGTVAFATGNTYAVESRETDGRHPNEHRLAAFGTDDGAPTLRWDADLQGFVHELAAVGDTIVAPCAQNFRVRDPETHAVRWFDRESGVADRERFDGIVTAAAVDGGTLALIEEPVEYHDDGETRGEYALRIGSIE